MNRAPTKTARIYYVRRPEMETAEEKISFLANNTARSLGFDEVQPDKAHNWVNLTSNDFDTLIPLVSKDTKAAKTAAKERAIFKTFSMGVTTNRDDWLYDKSQDTLENKVSWFLSVYCKELQRVGGQALSPDKLDCSIKWTRALLRALQKRTQYQFDAGLMRSCGYRPYAKEYLYFTPGLNEYMYDLPAIFPNQNTVNFSINISVGKEFVALASNQLVDLHFVGDTILVPLKRFGTDGDHADNITDWGLKQFRQHYTTPVIPAQAGIQPNQKPPKGQKAKPLDSRLRGNDDAITKEAIFHYCYAVLHDPLYREKYALNLKREFPRIPFYLDFWQWAAWGEALMKLHIGYESVAPFKLKRIDIPDEKVRASGLSPKALLRADKDAGSITLDSETTLRGIPSEAWDYKLGNRCALEWVLDQYKEKKPKDPTIREKFDTYRFADYKEKVVDLLMRVTTVSVETVLITQAMKQAAR